MKILIFAEAHNGKLKKGTLELLTAAQAGGLKPNAVMLGSGSSQLAQELGSWGVAEFFVSENSAYDRYNPELFTQALSAAIKDSGAEVVLASSNSLGRDLFPRVAGSLNTSTASDCTELSLSGGLKVRRPMYSGKCTAAVEFQSGPAIVLMRANQLPVGSPSGQGSAQVKQLPNPDTNNLKTLIKDIVKGASEKLDLTEANIIVAGGRGLKDASNFKLITDLAETCGATVGASRAIVDAGWVPHSMQVGQTGKTVAPTLYFAIGISGAIQHLAGMSGSKVIVAINKDGNAPIFQKATYGIVGDLFEVVPALIPEMKALLG